VTAHLASSRNEKVDLTWCPEKNVRDGSSSPHAPALKRNAESFSNDAIENGVSDNWRGKLQSKDAQFLVSAKFVVPDPLLSG
jgi:hypothetical protein